MNDASGAGAPTPESDAGDDACWAHLLCPACDRVLDQPRPARCPACGADLDHAED